MQPDLTKPGAGDALEAVVSLVVEAAGKDDAETMFRAGQAFGRLCELVGGDRDALRQFVMEEAANTVRIAAGMRPAS